MGDDTTKGLKGTICVDGQQLQGHVSEVVRSSVEDTLNEMLAAEADQLCRAQRCERVAGAGRHAGWPLRAQAARQALRRHHSPRWVGAHPRAGFLRRVRHVLQQALALRDRYLDGQVSAHGLAVARGRLLERLTRLLD